MRRSDVMGNIGEIPRQRDVNGRVAICQNRALPSAAMPPRQKKTTRSVPTSLPGRCPQNCSKNGTLKTYKDFPHGMPTTQADMFNSYLLAFLKL